MEIHVALLRAVNVGGTGVLQMHDLKAICIRAGLDDPRTYIASGNVVFGSPGTEAEIKATLEQQLQAHVGKPIPVMVRTAAELERIVRANPFAQSNPAHTMVVFLDLAPDPSCLAAASGWAGEAAQLGAREIYIHYGAGMARSKLRIPAARPGTARNMNTVAKLAGLARQRQP